MVTLNTQYTTNQLLVFKPKRGGGGGGGGDVTPIIPHPLPDSALVCLSVGLSVSG